MKIATIKELLNAEVVCGNEHLDREMNSAFGSDMMSDVLAYANNQAVLITGLVNPQVIRTAEMLDMICIVFVRGKTPTAEVVNLAKESGMILLRSEKKMYEACGRLYEAGLGRNGDAV